MQQDCYVLFRTNTHAMMLDAALKKEGIPARISPTPHDMQGRAGCGIAILVSQERIESVRECIARNALPCLDIECVLRQINPRRDRFM